MEYIALFVLLMWTLTVNCQPVKDETEELRSILKQSMDQNRRFEQQMNRLKLVWSGLGQLCQTLAQPACTCENEPESVTPKPDEVSTNLELDNKSILKVLSLESSGNKSNTVHVTVNYNAVEDHVTDWFLLYYKYRTQGLYRTGGKTRSHGFQRFSSTLTISVDSLEAIILNIYSEPELVAVSFNVEAIMRENKLILPTYAPALISTPFTYYDPNTEDMHISVTMNGSVKEWSDQLERLTMFFTSINMSASPPALFEINMLNSDLFNVSISYRTNDTSTILVTLDETLVDSGGLFSIQSPIKLLPMESRLENILQNINQGYLSKFLPTGNGEILPSNSVALYPMKNVTIVMPITTLMCIAIGNPSPNVNLYRVLKNGKRKKIRTEMFRIGKEMSVRLYTLRADNRKTTGQYICRAKSGTSVVEDSSSVIVYKPVTFDDTMTGVIRNSTDEIVYGCKVSWTMKPDLEFRMSSQYGQVIKEDERNKISVVQTDKQTSQITLTISPADNQLHTVVCVSRVGTIEEYREIELFPGMDPSWDIDIGNDMYNATFNLTEKFV